jgi:TRAP-type C4-dicarboxylate transport system substrate-binding protein
MDLHGLHIRVPQSPVMAEVFKALGANAEQLPFPELFDALRTGRFEAQENPIATILAANFAQVQSHVSMTGHVYSVAIILASPDLIEDLDQVQRTALVEAARVGARASRETGSAAEHRGLDALRASGMTIVRDVDRDALEKAARPTLDAIAQRLGAERAARIRAFEG